MKIVGIEKFSLVDYDGYTACTVFTPGCNLRCPFCQNATLFNAVPLPSEIPEQEIFSYLKKREGLIDALCISGGEPTLMKDLPDFIRTARAYGVRIKLDTNGTNPSMLSLLLEQNLINYVAMDIKNSPQKYSVTAGTEIDVDKIQNSIDLLRQSTINYEFRTTVVREFHNENDIETIGVWLADAPAYYLQQFRDNDTNLVKGLHAHDEQTLFHFKDILLKYMPRVEIRGL